MRRSVRFLFQVDVSHAVDSCCPGGVVALNSGISEDNRLLRSSGFHVHLSHTLNVCTVSELFSSRPTVSVSVRLAGGVGINKGIEQSEVSETLA